MLTDALFTRLFPACPASKRKIYRPLLVAALNEFGITTRARLVAFVAQVGHESLDFKYMQEIASGAAYEGRLDLGNTQPGDGRRFKGRGPLQTTGRENYEDAAAALGLPLLTHPELLEEPEHGFRASCFFWEIHKLNELADRLTLTGDASDLQQFDKLTRVLNGVQSRRNATARADRRRRYQIARVALPSGVLSNSPFEQLEKISNRVAPKATLPEPSAPTPAGPVGPAASETAKVFDDDLIDTLAANAPARGIGKKALVRVGKHLGRPVALGLAVLEAGNVYAWAGVIVLLVGMGVLIYVERSSIKKAALWLAAKVKRRLKEEGKR